LPATVDFGVVEECPTDPRPHDIAVVAEDLWVTPARTDTLQRCAISRPSAQPDAYELGPGVPQGQETGHQIVSMPGFLYITRRHARTLARVDLSDMSIDDVVIEGAPLGAALIGDTVWVTSNSDDSGSGWLTPVDTTTMSAGTPIELPFFPGHVRAIDGELWVAHPYNSAVGRVDPVTGTVGEESLPGASFDILQVDGEIWITLWKGSQVAVVDPSTGGVTELIDVGARPYMLLEAFGSVWVSKSGADPGSISRLDPATRREVQPSIPVGSAPVALAADADRLYVADFGGESVMVLAPES
jgi:hypothetical protein